MVSEEIKEQGKKSLVQDYLSKFMDKICTANIERFFSKEAQTRRVTVRKGDKLHQLTIGAGGRELYTLCSDHVTAGDFLYGEDLYFGYALVHVNEEKLIIEVRGVAQPSEVVDSDQNYFDKMWSSLKSSVSMVSSPPQDGVLMTIEILRGSDDVSLIQ